MLQRYGNVDTALNRAMKGGHAQVVKFLLSQGTKVSSYTQVYIQQYNAKELLQFGNFSTKSISLIKKVQGKIFLWIHDFLEIFVP